MLDPDYLNAAGEMTAAVYTQIESEMLEYLTKRMIEGDITNQRSQTALLLLSQSNSQGLLAILNSHKGEISASVSKEVSGALKRSDADDLKRIKKGMGVELPSITSRQIATTVAGVRDILARENLNMVQSAQTAFLTQSIWAITQVNTGAMTTEKALHSAVRKLEGEGISLISYRNTKTGRQTVKNKVDVAIRRHIRTQILQDSMRRTEQILDDAGVELVEVSSHGGARPSHAEWEGRVYSRHGDKVIDGVKYKDFKTACKWGDVADGIGGANCRHSYSAYFPGMKRMYEPDPEHPSGKSNAEVYDLTQKQRSYERDIRDAKRELSGAEQLYKDNPTLENQAEAAKAKLKLQNKQAKMRELINDNPEVLQRSPRREWAGDMPKVKVPKASGRKIDDFLESKSKQLNKAGISKKRIKSALSTELGELGLTTRDFSRLTAKDQVGLFEKVRNSIDAKLPSTKKAFAGKHTIKPFQPASGVDGAIEFATKEFGVDATGTMYEEIGVNGANYINESLYQLKSAIGTVELQDIRYKAVIHGDRKVVATYSPAGNRLFFSKAVKGKNAEKKMADMAKNAHKSGWWSTGNKFTVVNHEMGHYAHNQLDEIGSQTACNHYLEFILDEQREKAAAGKEVDWARWARGLDIDEEIVKRAKENGLSGYALANTDELVAESFAQLYDETLSDTSKSVLKTLLEHARYINNPNNALLKRRLENACL